MTSKQDRLMAFSLYSLKVNGANLVMADDLSKRALHENAIITRGQWDARQASRIISPMKLPIPYVVIHHSYVPPACFNKEQCCTAMKQMQDFHMDHHKWADIGYHFAVGSDGYVYEGRGWKLEGSHACNFNPVSLGICLIGDWCDSVPPFQQIKAVTDLIATGVQLGYIKKDYRLIGHRQVRATECPGDALFEYIKTWDHYSAFPACVKDILELEEIPEDIKNNILKNLQK